MKQFNQNDFLAFMPYALQFAPIAIVGGVARCAVMILTAQENGKPINRLALVSEIILATITTWATMSVLIHWQVDVMIAAPISSGVGMMGYKGYLSIIKNQVQKHFGDNQNGPK